MHTLLRRGLPLAALFVGFALLLGTTRAADDGFKPLFNGKDFTGLKFEIKGDPEKTFSVKDGVIVVSGKPNGYFYTDKSYKNYVLQAEFKYPDKAGNSGYLIHITGDHKVWPKCVEVQGQYAGVCSIFPIGGVKGPRADDAEARKKATKPHNEWNTVEIVCKDGKITSSLNGTKIADAGPYDVMEGPIGFQSEGTEIHFRNIKIKEMK